MRSLLTCWRWHDDCRETPQWVVEWRRDYFDPYLRGVDDGQLVANNACQKHLVDLIAWISRDWDGHMHVMSTEFYLYARIQKRKATSGEGLGAAWRWPRSVTKP